MFFGTRDGPRHCTRARRQAPASPRCRLGHGLCSKQELDECRLLIVAVCSLLHCGFVDPSSNGLLAQRGRLHGRQLRPERAVVSGGVAGSDQVDECLLLVATVCSLLHRNLVHAVGRGALAECRDLHPQALHLPVQSCLHRSISIKRTLALRLGGGGLLTHDELDQCLFFTTPVRSLLHRVLVHAI